MLAAPQWVAARSETNDIRAGEPEDAHEIAGLNLDGGVALLHALASARMLSPEDRGT